MMGNELHLVSSDNRENLTPAKLERVSHFLIPTPTPIPVGKSRARALIVEDDPVMARVIAATLAKTCHVAIASDGQDGLEQALSLPPDLILCDMSMPRINGEQLVKALRSRSDYDDVPIVVLSESADEKRLVEMLREGAQDYLIKPFNREELRARVANLLTMRQVRRLLEREIASQGRNLVTLTGELIRYKRDLSKAFAMLQSREARLQERARELEQVNIELQRQRDDLLLLNAALTESDRARSQFLATIFHKLRIPIASIIGFSQLLLAEIAENELDTRRLENQQRILNNAQHLLDLINNVLDLSKIEAGRMETAAIEVDVRELLTAVVEETHSLAVARNLVLRAVIEEGVTTLQSDPMKLKQVVLNLVSNALKFTEKGEITVSARQVDIAHLAIEVKDTGIGIPEELREWIFQAYSQFDGSYTRKAGGTGLGLSIVKELTTLLGGEIEQSSAPGQGSTFTVTLPIKPAQRQYDRIH
jgi:signal transduction histidine kinase